MANLREDLCWVDIGERLSGSHRWAKGCWGLGSEGRQEGGCALDEESIRNPLSVYVIKDRQKDANERKDLN